MARATTDPQITIVPNPNRIIIRVDGAIIADSTRALVMRAPGTPDQHYIPREHVDMTRLSRTIHRTHCPYKGDASYWTIRGDQRVIENGVWSYEDPREGMALIKGYLAFYQDRVDRVEEGPPTE